jgi:hypothetical protein
MFLDGKKNTLANLEKYFKVKMLNSRKKSGTNLI